MASFRKFLDLTFPEKLVFCRAFLLVLSYRRALKSHPFDELMRGAAARAEKRLVTATADSLPAGRISWLISKAATVIIKSRCLPQALAGQIIFAEYGYRTDFHIGVRKESDKLEAHAWLTLDGEVVLGDLPDLALFEELVVNGEL